MDKFFNSGKKKQLILFSIVLTDRDLKWDFATAFESDVQKSKTLIFETLFRYCYIFSAS